MSFMPKKLKSGFDNREIIKDPGAGAIAAPGDTKGLGKSRADDNYALRSGSQTGAPSIKKLI